MSLWDPARYPAPRGCTGKDSFLADFGGKKERFLQLLLLSLHEAKSLSLSLSPENRAGDGILRSHIKNDQSVGKRGTEFSCSHHQSKFILVVLIKNILFLCYRGDWFLLESRKVRHVAVGVFCCAVLAYLAALSTYVTMAFQRETGITCACIFSSGVVVLIITVIHVLIRASKATQRSVSHNLYENDSAQSGETPTVVPPSDAPKMASSQSRAGTQDPGNIDL
uniref:Transmembrane protein 221 n=1 Tax=Pseudonaja textilis TaxID=8673 RepID=A0A670Y1C7_PSETE